MGRGPRFTEDQAREAIAASRSYAEALRRLKLRAAGGNHRTLQKYAALWQIPTDHFDQAAVRREALSRARRPLDEILVADSTYRSRGSLKLRLYKEGLKERVCELCGQGEIWRGQRIALILDHINGLATDNRLENLQIVCPNCAAALPTHCGRNVKLLEPRTCAGCGASFQANFLAQRFCTPGCHGRSIAGRPVHRSRKVERPPSEQLLSEVLEIGYVAVGRKYGVSDTAIRKWFRWAGVEPPRGTWPNRRRDSAESSGARAESSAQQGQLEAMWLERRFLQLRDLHDLERATAIASEGLELLKRPVGLEDLGAIRVGADKQGAKHLALIVRTPPDVLKQI